jgi:4-phytase/acid phosphatase
VVKALALCAVAILCLSAGTSRAMPRGRFVVERAVLVMRHGIRAPLDGEVPEGTRTGAPWPQWPVAASRITPHGARALAIVAAADRRMLTSRGLSFGSGCSHTLIRIRTNSSDRTVASGEAYARGFAAACEPAIEHLPIGTADPIFEPLRAYATRFDAAAAIASINQETGGMEALVRRHRPALALLDRVLGCTPRGLACVPAGAAGVDGSHNGDDIVLSGPVRASSGIAQVLLLQYLEGMPRHDVGWGRVTPARLKRLGALHAALFAVFTRPAYMAVHQSAVLGPAVLDALSGGGPKLTLFMGHDTNVTALAAALGIDLQAPGYATNDVPPGGALLFERLRNARTNQRFVRLSYRTQSPRTLRTLTAAVSITALKLPGCRRTLCPLDRFSRILVPAVSAGTQQARDAEESAEAHRTSADRSLLTAAANMRPQL